MFGRTGVDRAEAKELADFINSLDAHHENVLKVREEDESAVYALARVYTSLAVLERSKIKRFGGVAGEVTKAIEEAMRLANPKADQTTLDHLTERALGIANSPQLAPLPRGGR